MSATNRKQKAAEMRAERDHYKALARLLQVENAVLIDELDRAQETVKAAVYIADYFQQEADGLAAKYHDLLKDHMEAL